MRDEEEVTEAIEVIEELVVIEDGAADPADAEPIAGEDADPDAPPPMEEAVVADGDDSPEEDGSENGEEEPASEDEVSEDDASEGDAETAVEEGEGAPALPLLSVVEAVLFAAREPLKAPQIARAVGKGTRQDAVKAAIEELNVHYLETGRAFEIAEISGKYQLMSRPEYINHIMRIYPKRETGEKEKTSRLTPAALDTLSIIAYKQPVTRGEIEHIRGVGCGPVLRALIERGSVQVAGKKMDVVGQPLVYGTTENFLVEFGLGSLDELPLRNEFLGVMGELAMPVEPVAEPGAPADEIVADVETPPEEENAEGGDDGEEEPPSES